MKALSREEAARQLLSRRRARKELGAFALYVKPDYESFHHSKILCDYLTRFALGEITRLMLTMGPQRGKSLHSSILLPAFCLGLNPEDPVLILSYGESLASDFCDGTRDIMSSVEYTDLFPESYLKQRTERKVESSATRFEIPGHAGLLETTGGSGSVTGRGFGKIIVDDLIKNSEEAQSATYRQRKWDTYASTIRSRRRNYQTGILILNTRWHEDDINGRLLQLAKDDPNADQWVVLNLPELLADCSNPQEEAWKFPAGQEPGKEVLWPERFPYSDVISTKASDPYYFNAMYMGSPTSREGNQFKKEYFTYVDGFSHEADSLFVSYWDLGGSDAETSDQTVNWLIHKTQGGIYTFVEFDAFRLSKGERNKRIYNVEKAHRDKYESIGPIRSFVEWQMGTAVEVTKDIVRECAEFGLQEDHVVKNLAERAQPLEIQMQNGNVRFLKAPWNRIAEDEFLGFPTAKHDDMVSAGAGAFNCAAKYRFL